MNNLGYISRSLYPTLLNKHQGWKNIYSIMHKNHISILNRGQSFSVCERNILPMQRRLYSKQVDENKPQNKLKRVIAEYGSTVLVLHIGISLVSLGVCYVAIDCGVDIPGLLKSWGIGGKVSSVATGASTFVVAYAVHKLFAPVRISITLATAPLLVKYLRNIGFLKIPKK